MKNLFFSLFFLFSLTHLNGQTVTDYRWLPIEAKGDVVGRHENGFIEYKNKFYLIGGRGVNPVNVFDPKTDTWETKGKSPMEIHHFQAVVYGNSIYLVGAMTGGYPKELPLDCIWKYYPETDKWVKGAEIPVARRRGGAGAVVYNDKIYIAGGIKFGHTSGTTNMFDSYDLKTGKWETLTDAPHIRDHFPAIVANDKLYCIGGRNGSVHYPDNFSAFFSATIPQVDYFDFKEGKWLTLNEPLPVPTAAGGLVKMDSLLIYMGGEGSKNQAYNETQCLNINTNKWTQLASMYKGKHGSGAVLYNNEIYIAAGSPNKGGGNLSSIEKFTLNHNFEKLFNGINLDGWQVKAQQPDIDNTFWTFDNGTIHCNSIGNKKHGHVWLMNDKEFVDFELRLKFKASHQNKGNSGVQVHSRYDENAIIGDTKIAGWLDGPQVDIHAKDPWRIGLIYDETRTQKRWICPSLTDWKISKENTTHKKVMFYWEDEFSGWNDMTIICKGTNITSFLNSFLIVDYDGAELFNSEGHKNLNVGLKGHFALQLHTNDENKIWFKDIEVRELK